MQPNVNSNLTQNGIYMVTKLLNRQNPSVSPLSVTILELNTDDCLCLIMSQTSTVAQTIDIDSLYSMVDDGTLVFAECMKTKDIKELKKKYKLQK